MTTDETEETEPAVRRPTYVHNRYHVGCSCCNLVCTESRKWDAVAAMLRHMERHPLTDDDATFTVYDSMARGGGRFVYGGQLINGVYSQGPGVGYKA